MFEIYVGLYENLTQHQQKAVTALTVTRYLEDYYYLSDWLQTELKLMPGTPAFKKAYYEHVDQITNAFAAYDRNTHISVIFYKSNGHQPIALSTIRCIRGARKDVMLPDSIGSENASIPTHTLLQSFSYPHLPYFDANTVSEADICECSRRATISRQQILKLINEGVMDPLEAQYFSRFCTDHTMVAHCRFLHQDLKACIFNIRPFHTHSFLEKGIKFIPLFGEGVEPTQYALDSNRTVLAPLFEKWPGELQKISDGIMERYSVREAIKHLWQRFMHAGMNMKGWRSCNIPLPFLLVFDEQWYAAVQRIEGELYKQPMFFRYNINNSAYETHGFVVKHEHRQVA